MPVPNTSKGSTPASTPEASILAPMTMQVTANETPVTTPPPLPEPETQVKATGQPTETVPAQPAPPVTVQVELPAAPHEDPIRVSPLPPAALPVHELPTALPQPPVTAAQVPAATRVEVLAPLPASATALTGVSGTRPPDSRGGSKLFGRPPLHTQASTSPAVSNLSTYGLPAVITSPNSQQQQRQQQQQQSSYGSNSVPQLRQTPNFLDQTNTSILQHSGGGAGSINGRGASASGRARQNPAASESRSRSRLPSDLVASGPILTDVEVLTRFDVTKHSAASPDGFFVYCPEEDATGARNATGEMAFASNLSDFTSEGSISEGSQVLELSPRLYRDDKDREAATHSVAQTLEWRRETKGRNPDDVVKLLAEEQNWMHQISVRAVALSESSFFVFSPYQLGRVVLYNFFHHWLFEMFLFFEILSYAIFQACWARYVPPIGDPPNWMLWANVLYTTLFTLEGALKLYTLGCILHMKSYFRSIWNWLDMAVIVLAIINCASNSFGNYTSLRLLRLVKCLTYFPRPICVRLISKSFLRATWPIIQVILVMVYGVLFYGLIGLQLFSGKLRNVCYNPTTLEVSGLCNPESRGTYWFYWGRQCPVGFVCQRDPGSHDGDINFGFKNFDDIGHAMLSVFQIASFQNWPLFLVQTNDTMNVLSFLFYLCLILTIAFVLPNIVLGIYLEKFDRTKDDYISRQLRIYEELAQEQRQRLATAIKVRRDAPGNGRASSSRNRRGPSSTSVGAYDSNKRSTTSVWAEVDDDRYSTASSSGTTSTAVHRRRQDKLPTEWTDEHRLQLHLALTRQHSTAQEMEAHRLRSKKATSLSNARQSSQSYTPYGGASLAGSPGAPAGSVGARSSMPQQGTQSLDHSGIGGGAASVPRPEETMRHVNPDGTISAAVRLDLEAQRHKFLDKYNANASAGRMGGIVTPTSMDRGGSLGWSHSRPIPVPPSMLGTNGATGVEFGVPMEGHHGGPYPDINGSESRHSLRPGAASPSAKPPSLSQPRTVQFAPEEAEVFQIQDPEGGNFKHAESVEGRWVLLRNFIHMVTEGYPRILSDYMWEDYLIRSHSGLLALSFLNQHEERAQAKMMELRQKHQENVDTEENVAGDEADSHVAPLVGEEDVRLTPIRAAQHIIHSAKLTWFNWLMLFFILFNGAILASRHLDQPKRWENGLWALSVIMTCIFFVEMALRMIALGPVVYLWWQFTNALDLVLVVLAFFELGYNKSNSILVINMVRFLWLMKEVRVVEPMRRVARTLHGALRDIGVAFIIFLAYFFICVLIAMTFYAGRFEPYDAPASAGYQSMDVGRFDNFSYAMFLVATAFSRVRDEWLPASWDGMRARGGYQIMFFGLVVLVALFGFQLFFVALFTYAFEEDEERHTLSDHMNAVFGKQRWFDFSLWHRYRRQVLCRDLERCHIAPEDVFQLNYDMRRQLRTAENRDRVLQATYPDLEADGGQPGHVIHLQPHFVSVQQQQQQLQLGFDWARSGATPTISHPSGPYHGSKRHAPSIPPGRLSVIRMNDFRASQAQLRFARLLAEMDRSVNLGATNNHLCLQPDGSGLTNVAPFPGASPDVLLAPNSRGGILLSSRSGRVTSPQQGGPPAGLAHESERSASEGIQASAVPNSMFPSMGGVSNPQAVLAAERRPRGMSDPDTNVFLATTVGQLTRSMGRATATGMEEDPIAGWKLSPSSHMEMRVVRLLNGPAYNYRIIRRHDNTLEYDRCEQCGAYKQIPFASPPGVEQKLCEQLHAEHCPLSVVRMQKLQILNVLLGFVRMQMELGVEPTPHSVQTVLGQAWSCGMLLGETMQYMCGTDLESTERSWDRMLAALEMQLWLLNLAPGEEQVGRATAAYQLSHVEHESDMIGDGKGSSMMRYSFFVLPPMNPLRRACRDVVQSTLFQSFILFCIFAASILLALYVPGEDRSLTKYTILYVFDDIFTVIFAIELVLKCIADGVVLPVRRAYLWSLWNIVDTFVVVISIISWANETTGLRYLKAIRCFRILLPLRSVTKDWNPSLTVLSTTMCEAIPTLANVCLLMLINYFIWTVLSIQLFMGRYQKCMMYDDMGNLVPPPFTILEESRCTSYTYPNYDNDPNFVPKTADFKWVTVTDQTFNNFYDSLLMMVEVSTGSWWLNVMNYATGARALGWSWLYNIHVFKGLFFVAYYFVAGIVMIALFIAAVVYCYMQTKHSMLGASGVTFHQQVWLSMQRMLMQLTPEVRPMALQNGYSRSLGRFVYHKGFEAFMCLILFFNIVTMCLYWETMGDDQRNALDILQYFWVGLFTLEAILKLLAFGGGFFRRFDNCFDLFIVVLSFLQIGLNTTSDHKVPFNVNVLRMLRVARVLPLLGYRLNHHPLFRHFRIYLSVLWQSLPVLLNVTAILALGVYVFAILGMHLLGVVQPVTGGYLSYPYNNFMTFVNSLIMTFRLVTVDGWTQMLRDTLKRDNCVQVNYQVTSCGTNWSPVFFVAWFVLGYLFILSLYIAVLIENYITAMQLEQSIRHLPDLQRFVALWAECDPQGERMIPTDQVLYILSRLRPPLGISSSLNRVELLRRCSEYAIPDHHGRVHFYDMLIPLARRAMSVSLSQDECREFDMIWRRGEKQLRTLPVFRYRYHIAEVDLHFAASYVAAAYRRRQARKVANAMRIALWRRALLVCEEEALAPETHGFGRWRLSDDIPAVLAEEERQRERSESLTSGLPLSGIPQQPFSASESVPRGSMARAASLAANTAGGGPSPPREQTLGQYDSALLTEKKFGPEVANAIRRHEKRSEKLARKLQKAGLASSSDAVALPAAHTPAATVTEDALAALPYGTHPEMWRDVARRKSQAVSTTLPPSPPATTPTAASKTARPQSSGAIGRSSPTRRPESSLVSFAADETSRSLS